MNERYKKIRAIARSVAGEWYVPGKKYHSALPAELDPWYVYCSDGGHCIVVALRSAYKENADPASFLIPAPVKSVLRGFEISGDYGDYIICDLEYSPTAGLATPHEDDEY